MNKKIFLFSLIICATSYAEVIKLDKSVITSSTGFITNTKDITSNPKIVTAQDIEDKQYTNIIEALKDIPGIDITYFRAEPIISLRGQGYDLANSFRAQNNVKIMIDGVANTTLNNQKSGTPLSAIPITSIERIEIIPGGGAILYGSGTTGGVINILTKKASDTRGQINYKYGDTMGHLTDFNIGHTIDKFDVDLSYSKKNGKGYRDHDENNVDSFLGKIRYDITKKQNIELKYTKITDERYFPEALSKKQVNEDRTQSGIKVKTKNNWQEAKTDEFVMNYNNQLSDNLEFNIMGFHKQVNTDSLSSSTTVNETSDKVKGIKTKAKYNYGNGNSLVFGVEYQRDDRKSTNGDDLARDTFAAFALNTYKIQKNTDFVSGIRWEKANNIINTRSGHTNNYGNSTRDEAHNIKKSFDEFAYELGVNHSYSDTGNVYFKYEKSFLLPPVLSMLNKTEAEIDLTNNLILEKEKWYAANIKAEKSDTFEFGIKDHIKDTHFSSAVFFTETNDEIGKDVSRYTGMFFPGTPQYNLMGSYFLVRNYNYNLGKTQKKGIDLGIEHHFEKLTLRANYNYIDAKVKKGKKGKKDLAGTKIPNVAEHKLNVGIDYQITDKFLIMGDYIYSGGIYVANSMKIGQSFGKQNEYQLFNLSAKYSVTPDFNLYAGINNLFNEKYYNYVGPSGKNLEYDPAPERNYYAGFSYTF